MAYYGSYKILEKDFPSIYNHLIKYENNLKARGQVKYTSSGKIKEGSDYPGQHHWLELDNNPSLDKLEDLSQQKIIYPDIMRMPKNLDLLKEYPYFYFDDKKYIPEATTFVITGKSLIYICLFLTSDIGFFAFTKFYAGPQFDDTGFRYKKDYLNSLYLPDKENDFWNLLLKKGILQKSSYTKEELLVVDQIFYQILDFNTQEQILIKNYKSKILNV